MAGRITAGTLQDKLETLKALAVRVGVENAENLIISQPYTAGTWVLSFLDPKDGGFSDARVFGSVVRWTSTRAAYEYISAVTHGMAVAYAASQKKH